MKLFGIFRKMNILALTLLCLGLTACTNESIVSNVIPDETDVTETSSVFIYSDTCVVTSVSKNAQSITFQNLETGLRYTLSYDNLTYFSDRYGNSLTGSQLTAGQICDITFYREDKLLKTLEYQLNFHQLRWL